MERSSVGLVIGQLHQGGAEKQLATLALGLRDDPRILPIVYCLSEVTEPHGPQLQREGVELRMFNAATSSPWSRLQQLKKTVQDDGLSILHAFLLGPAIQSAIVSGVGGGPIFVASNRTCGLPRPPLRRLLERWALNRACMVTVNSTAAVEFTDRYYRVPRDRIRYIPNGIAPFGSGLPDRASAREELDLSLDQPVLLGVFRLSPEKDLEAFCDVVDSVLERSQGAVCLVAGDGPLRPWFEARIHASPHEGRFRWLGARDDVPRLLSAADLLLLTSRHEGMPNGVLEAMSAGLPVVATNVGGVPDLLRDGTSGFIRAVGDKQGLADACLTLLGDRESARRIGMAARKRADERFSNDVMIQTYRELYHSLLADTIS